MSGASSAQVAVVLIDVDEHPLSPFVIDAVFSTTIPVEVVVVDARTTPGRAWLGDRRIKLVKAEPDESGTARRLRAVSECRAGLIAFLDARTVPEAGWLEAAVDSMRDGEIAALTGAVDGIGEPTLSFSGNVGQAHPTRVARSHDVLYALPELAIVRREHLTFDDLSMSLPWANAVVELSWRLRLRGLRVVLDPRVRATGGCTCAADPYAGLVVLFTMLGDETLEAVLPAAMVVASASDAVDPPVRSSTIDRFMLASSSLAARRRAVQSTRTVSDDEILPLLIAPIEPPRGHEAIDQAYRDVVARNGLGTALESRKRILVVTPDIFTSRMAGPAIRAWQIADALADRHVVTLASTGGIAEVSSDRFDVIAPNDFALRRLAADVDVVVAQGFAIEGRPYLKAEDKVLVVDIYDPLHLEQLELFRDEPDEKRRVVVREATRVLNEQLVRGDFFVCASPKQRDFWLGQLAGLGRLNHCTYDENGRFETLLSVVPFGVPNAPASATGPGAKTVVEGIGETDKVILWGGGIYNWFDPLSVIRAVDRLKERVPEVRLFFMGLRHPNPEVSEMRVSMEARRLAKELGLVDRYVFFNEGWVPYDERQNYLLEASAGVSTHLDHIETEFSFRTRLLDYIWAALPIVATQGDWFADLIDREELGVTVPARDVDALEEALFRVLCDEDFSLACKANLERIREQFVWSRVLEPITSFCRFPKRAADLSDVATRASLWTSDQDRLAAWLRQQPKGIEKLRRMLAEW